MLKIRSLKRHQHYSNSLLPILIEVRDVRSKVFRFPRVWGVDQEEVKKECDQYEQWREQISDTSRRKKYQYRIVLIVLVSVREDELITDNMSGQHIQSNPKQQVFAKQIQIKIEENLKRKPSLKTSTSATTEIKLKNPIVITNLSNYQHEIHNKQALLRNYPVLFSYNFNHQNTIAAECSKTESIVIPININSDQHDNSEPPLHKEQQQQ